MFVCIAERLTQPWHRSSISVQSVFDTCPRFCSANPALTNQGTTTLHLHSHGDDFGHLELSSTVSPFVALYLLRFALLTLVFWDWIYIHQHFWLHSACVWSQAHYFNPTVWWKEVDRGDWRRMKSWKQQNLLRSLIDHVRVSRGSEFPLFRILLLVKILFHSWRRSIQTTGRAPHAGRFYRNDNKKDEVWSES